MSVNDTILFLLTSLINTSFIMYIVFTTPNKFTKTIDEACEIRDEWFNQTGEIVAVEYTQPINN